MRTKLENPVDEKAEKEPKDVMDDYEVKDHFDTLMRAHAIQSDPEKMMKVHALAGRHQKALKGIKKPKAIKSTQDLKDTYDEKFGSGTLKK